MVTFLNGLPNMTFSTIPFIFEGFVGKWVSTRYLRSRTAGYMITIWNNDEFRWVTNVCAPEHRALAGGKRAAVSSACNVKQLLLEPFICSNCGFLLVFIEYFITQLMLHITTLNEAVLQRRISFTHTFLLNGQEGAVASFSDCWRSFI